MVVINMTEEELLPICACGVCGLRVAKMGNRFIHGHNGRGIPRSPETCAAISTRKTGVPLSPKHCTSISKGKKGVPNSPEHNASISKATKGVPHTSAAHLAADEAKRSVPLLHTSEAQLTADDAKRGGNDIVNHHWLYDHSDLSKNTIKMTRSHHTWLHNLFRKLGYIVPHINVKEELL